MTCTNCVLDCSNKNCAILTETDVVVYIKSEEIEAHNLVPRSIQVVDHVVENSDKSSSKLSFLPYKVPTGKGITLNADESTVHEDHVSKTNWHELDLPAIQFLTYWRQKCTKSKLCGCPVHYE